MCLPSSLFVLVVGCGLCDFFVLLCFVCSHQHDFAAAMFVVVVVVLVVCSLFRAHGGCLGMLSR